MLLASRTVAKVCGRLYIIIFNPALIAIGFLFFAFNIGLIDSSGTMAVFCVSRLLIDWNLMRILSWLFVGRTRTSCICQILLESSEIPSINSICFIVTVELNVNEQGTHIHLQKIIKIS